MSSSTTRSASSRNVQRAWPGRLGTAAQRNDFGFLFAIEDLLPRETHLRLAIQGGFQTFEHETFADVLDRANRDPAGFGDGLILPGRTVPTAIRQQQHLRVSPFLRGDPLLLHQLRKFLPFLLVELDEIPLVHASPPWVGTEFLPPLEKKPANP